MLDRLLDAELHFVEPDEASDFTDQLLRELEGQGARPYVIPAGGSNEIGALGYALLAEELSDFKLPGKDGLTVLNDRPINAETPAHLLDDAITPTNRHFIRNNSDVTTAIALEGVVEPDHSISSRLHVEPSGTDQFEGSDESAEVPHHDHPLTGD